MAVIKWRPWQERVFNLCEASDSSDFLMVACPGSGKTLAALRIAQAQRSRIVVVTHTIHLKYQWAKTARILGIELDPRWQAGQGPVKKGYHGVVVTYQSLVKGAAVSAHQGLIHRQRTTVIFDEIHHGGEEQPWGMSVKEAFSGASKRLAISGTPFRSDGRPIPFIRYDDTGNALPDYSYTYADAIFDKVCRPMVFETQAGRLEWQHGAETREATFEDELDRQETAERLKTALSANNRWVSSVLRMANDKLIAVRQGQHPNAGGLVVCMDQDHARDIARVLKKITGEQPKIAISDEEDSLGTINDFVGSSSAWLVSVRMVSEGVDIPRLRVGVYLSHIVTEVYFRQVVGRFTRVGVGKENSNSYLYIPDDNRLVAYSEMILKEIRHTLRESPEAANGDRENDTEWNIPLPAGDLFYPISAEALSGQSIISGVKYTAGERAVAEAICRRIGKEPTEDTLHTILMTRKIQEEGLAEEPPLEDSDNEATESVPLYIQEENLRKEIDRLAKRCAFVTGREVADIHTRLFKIQGAWVEALDLEQLQRRKDILVRWIQEAKVDSAA